jgi:uncharacterized protein (DUF362 family)
MPDVGGPVGGDARRGRPVCSVARGKNVRKTVVEALGRIDLPDLDGKRILLKPNIGRNVPPRTGVDTNPDVTEAVFEFLSGAYDASFFIGDSPILGVDCREAFANSGHGGFLDREDIEFVDLDSRRPITLEIPDGRVLKKIKVTGYLNDFDYVVSIPVLKMHMHTGASLGYKNMKGMLYKREKVKLHQLHMPEAKEAYGHKELDLAIADLAMVLEPDLVVCDATFGLEGMGPSAGDRRRLDTVIASNDYLAADLVALAIVGLDIEHVPHLKLIAEQKGGVTSLADIATIPEDIGRFRVDFAVPPTEIVIENHMVNLLDEGSCSACQSSVYLFLKNNEALIGDYIGECGHFNIAIGSDVADVPEDTFLIGNCTVCHKDKGTFLVGCPPSQTIVMETVREKLAEKEGNG